MDKTLDTLIEKGALYVVATPIGNLKDITFRAVDVLTNVDLIAAEDTRHSQRLLRHYSIKTPITAVHEHNERQVALKMIEKMQAGTSIALVSDAGTPLVSDPGYNLINLAHQHNIKVIPIPGASAVLSALCSSGLPVHRFTFEGFLPAKAKQRQQFLHDLAQQRHSMVFFEAPHRLLDTIGDMVSVFGEQRPVTLARELTKTFETIRNTTLNQLLHMVETDRNQQKGEIVLVVQGADAVTTDVQQYDAMLNILMAELPLKQAAAIASNISGLGKNELYKRALILKQAL